MCLCFILNFFSDLYAPFSFMPQVALEEIHKFTGSYTCMNTFKGRTWTLIENTMRVSDAAPRCIDGNMDIKPSGSDRGPTIEWGQTWKLMERARWLLLQLEFIDKLQDPPGSYMYVYAYLYSVESWMSLSLWTEAMRRFVRVVILGVFILWHF